MVLTSPQQPPTKAARVKKLLSRGKGATLDEICNLTNWKPHSVRAFLTGLRKKGVDLAKEQRGDTGTAYRIVAASKRPVTSDKPKRALQDAVTP